MRASEHGKSRVERPWCAAALMLVAGAVVATGCARHRGASEPGAPAPDTARVLPVDQMTRSEAAPVEPTEDEVLWASSRATAAYDQQRRIARQELADQPWVSLVIPGEVYAYKGVKELFIHEYEGRMWVQEQDGNYQVREKSFALTHPTGRLLKELETEIDNQ